MVKQRSSGTRRWIGVIAILGLLAGLLLPLANPNVPAQAAIGACNSPTDCLSKMTLDEKIGQMTQANHDGLVSPSDITTYYLGSLLSGGGAGPNGPGGTASQWADMYDNYQSYAIATRLGIPLIYGVDAVHGHNNVQGAVIFPHHIGMGATRNVALVEQAEAITRDEVLGTGMNWVFAPTIAVPQNDRWGRTYEGYGEDTALVSAMGAAAIRGFQGLGLGPTTVMATAKHYVGDGGTTNGIDQGDTQVSEAVLRAVHLPPYQSAIANNVGSVMISFSSWNGQKLHGHQYLITNVLKGELGFKGIVITDWAGIDQLPGDYASDVRTAVNAGIDMVMVPTEYQTFISTLKAEVNAGRVPMSRIDDAVLRILTQKFALGLFTKYRTDRTYTAQVGSAAHRAVARQAVRESLVLLKNDGVLPLSKTATYRIVVGGSHVNNLGYQMGGWSISWQGESGATTTGTTFWQAIQAAKPANVTLQNVGTNTGSSFSGDIGIAVIGETPYAEGDGDSTTLAVSSANAQQVNDICSKTTRCIVILMSGRPLIINTQIDRANAFVAAWLPGTEGSGMTDVLFGDYNFSGKLPVTWPNAISQEPINTGDGKTGLFPYGFGLTYSSIPTSVPTTGVPPTTPPPTTQAGQAPYGGTAWAIPGTIQAENYDTGGEGAAYHDTTSGNSGNAYRTTERVDVESTTDSGGGYNVGWTAAGEWLEYTVNVAASGTYTLNARVASQSSGGTIHVEVDGVNVTGALAIPSTGGWQTWTTVTRTGISLSAGQHVLRVAEDSAGFNVNWVSLTGSGTPQVTTPPPTTPPATTPPPTTPPPTTPPATTPPPTTPPATTPPATTPPPTTPPATTPPPTTSPGCSPVTSIITVPFTFDGAGTFCWQTNSLGGYINSWNLAGLTVNGVDFTNRWVGSGSYPPAINGSWYISYRGSFPWSHFEVR